MRPAVDRTAQALRSNAQADQQTSFRIGMLIFGR
jgi:hypothetical protein